MKRSLMLTAALLAALAVLVVLSFPPARDTLRPFVDGSVPGIIHVHTNRSDGRGTPDEIARAAARAGLKFVIITDHGDATRAPDPPSYRFGVLCVDAVEISTTEGHYIALDMPAAPYPLGGEARDVVEDVKRLGGFGIVAHPDSPKKGLRWQDWDLPFDGIEWINPDTSWRMLVQHPGWRSRWDIFQTLGAYPFRSSETIARMLAGTALTPRRWQSLVRQQRRIVLLAGADAHAKLVFGTAEPGDNRWSLPIPGYETSFRTLSVHVRSDRPWTGDAAGDATTLLRAIRRGQAFMAIDGLAAPAAFDFTASTEATVVHEGGEIPTPDAVTLRVRSNAPGSFTTVIWKDGAPWASFQDAAEFSGRAGGPGVYRVEIDAPSVRGTLPWIVSNPIYVGVRNHDPVETPARTAAERYTVFDGTERGWWIESDSGSTATVGVVPAGDGNELRLRYELRPGEPSGQYVNLSINLPHARPYRRARFTARADRPLRVSVQLRVPGSKQERWQRSIYIDQNEGSHSVEFEEMSPAGLTQSAAPDLGAVRDLMFVIDTIHTRPGSSGQLWIKSVVLER